MRRWRPVGKLPSLIAGFLDGDSHINPAAGETCDDEALKEACPSNEPCEVCGELCTVVAGAIQMALRISYSVNSATMAIPSTMVMAAVRAV